MRLNRRVPNGTHGGVRGRGYSAPPTRFWPESRRGQDEEKLILCGSPDPPAGRQQDAAVESAQAIRSLAFGWLSPASARFPAPGMEQHSGKFLKMRIRPLLGVQGISL